MEFLIFIISFFSFLQKPIYAADATSSAANNENVESLTNKLKEIVKGANTQEDQNVTDDKPKSLFGTITQTNDQQIIINTQNKIITLQLNDKTTFVDSKRQKSKLTNFKVGQTILSLGYFNQDGTFDCRRLIDTDNKSVENNNQIVSGKIVDVSQSQSSPIFVLVPFQNKNGQYQIKVDSKTEFNDNDQKKITANDIVINGKKIIAVIKPDAQSSQTFYASRIISLEISPTPTAKP